MVRSAPVHAISVQLDPVETPSEPLSRTFRISGLVPVIGRKGDGAYASVLINRCLDEHEGPKIELWLLKYNAWERRV